MMSHFAVYAFQRGSPGWLLGVVLMVACNGGPADHSDARVTVATHLRQAPDESSTTTQHLPEGAALLDLGEVSPYLSGIYLGDTLLWEPWLRMRTLEGNTGWVFGGFVQLNKASTGETLRWRCEKRLYALFGPIPAQRLMRWAAQPITTDTALAHHLREGLALRDTLQTALRYGLRRPTPDAQPDLRWLSPYLRYLRRYRGGIAVDYGLLAREAQQTRGQQDDYFAQSCIEAYPIDSMESPLPAWVFPLSWTESASNLGAGRHQATLDRLDDALQQAPLFQPEWQRLKDLVMSDILDIERSYWQPLPKILAELDALLAQPPNCLTAQERAALALRRQMLAQGLARTDLRSGR
ncbi:MAG: hypothetical protein RMJ33_04995 [Saprospiraceae bacterium]|nr:hypothetical protein [Saprospiraceae bacterium]MDW8229177.1 hypothetical protein [Saprospiraceae bacterium]